MRPFACFALALALTAPALAQADEQPAVPPSASSAKEGTLPLGAMLHHQPTRDQVDERERARLGAKKTEQQLRQEGVEEDQLYEEIMRRSAPAGDY
jgi:hypothetical protein